MPKPEITQEIVRSLFDYHPDTGHLTYKVRSARCVKIGDRAGSHDKRGYRQIKVQGWPFQEHRVVWLHQHGELPEGHIDHINCDGLDNRITNLRLATVSENMRNRGPYKSNTAGFKGVTFHKQSGRWQAACWANGRQNFLGLHDSPEAASAAYQSYAKAHHREFFRSS